MIKKTNSKGDEVAVQETRLEVLDFFDVVSKLYLFFKLDGVKK